jgi:hypothetical protein
VAKESQGLGSSEVIEGLADQISESIERRRAAKNEVPEVYKSGMRGNEETPAARKLREAKEAREKLEAKGRKKGVDPDKAARSRKAANIDDDDEDEEVDDNGRRKVVFKAGPSKKALAAENKKLKDQLAKLSKKRITI